MYSPDAIEEHRREVPIGAPRERHDGGRKVHPRGGRNPVVRVREDVCHDLPGRGVHQVPAATRDVSVQVDDVDSERTQ